MSTIVIPNQEQQPTSMNTATLSTTTVVSTSSPSNKRALDTAPPAPVKKSKMAAPMFRSNRYNWRSSNHTPNIDVTTGKDGKPSVQLHNASHSYNYQVMAPPGFVKWCHLGSGGDFGKKDWSTEEKGIENLDRASSSGCHAKAGEESQLAGGKGGGFGRRAENYKEARQSFVRLSHGLSLIHI